MRFIICGAGAVGGILGGQLAKAGYAVVFIEKDAVHRAAMQRQGLQLKGVHGTHTLHVPVVPDARDVRFRDHDIIFLAVKSFDSYAATAALRQVAGPAYPIFCAQNGVRNEAVAARFFQQVHGVMVLIGAKRLTPGEVIQTGNGPVGIGTYPTGVSQTATAVAAALDTTDLPIYTTDNIVAAKWHKLLLNLNNATMGLAGLVSEEASADPRARLWMADVWEEGWRVLQTAGIAIEGPPDMGSVAEHIRELRSPQWSPNVSPGDKPRGRSSLWQDLYHQRGNSEASDLNGEIVQLGRRYQVPTPYNCLLLTLVNAMAAARQGPGEYTIAQLRARLTAFI